MTEFLASLDWSPLWISLKTGIVTTLLCAVIGTVLAWKILFMRGILKAILDSILTLPMVLPPTVAGFLLLLLFSRRRPLGIFLFETFSIKVVQSFLGLVLASFVISLPLMYRSARSAFELVPENLVKAGQTLGMSEREIFFRVVLPAASPGLASGIILSFARAMGEYGATSMLAGNIPGRTSTISQRIALVMQDQDYLRAGFWKGIVLLMAFLLLFLWNTCSRRQERS